MSLRVAFYSHNGFGLGHVSRNLKLARTLSLRRPDAQIVVITGSSAVHRMRLPQRTTYVQLLPIRKESEGQWRSLAPDIPLDEVIRRRSRAILEAVRAFRPDLFVADFLPLGVLGELRPALEELRSEGRARTVVGFRDVLDAPSVIRETWAADGTYEALGDLYERVLVYGDQDWFDFSAYGLVEGSAQYVGLLGKLSARRRPRELREPLELLATCGGGVDGFPVLRVALEALPSIRQRIDHGARLTLLTGSLMDEDDVTRLADAAGRVGASVVRFESRTAERFSRADAVVAMAGSNTVTEILSLRLPAVIAPRSGPSQEQRIRAGILDTRRLAAAVPVEVLTADRLVEALASELDRQAYPISEVPNLNGLEGAADALLELA